jgi:phenylacetate-CoA ligase
MFATPENLERARAEAVFAYERVAFFERLYDAAGFRPQEIHTVVDWARLPTTSKADYRRSPAADMAVRGQKLDEPWLHRVSSSGSEGERVVTACARVVLSRRFVEALGVHPGFRFPLKERGYRTARLAAPNASEPLALDTPMADRILPDRTLLLPASNDLLATPPALLEQSARELCEYAPDLLYVDPNQLAVLVRDMARREVALPAVRAIACTNTMLTAAVRRQLTAAFAAPVSDALSMSELGWLGMECPQGALHVNSKSFLLELLVDDRPAAAGELGELCVTSFGDQVMPHVRYRTGDLYRLVEPRCPCGHAFPAVRMEGRATQRVRASDGATITARQIDDAVGAPAGLVLYQLARDGDVFVLRYLADDELDDDERDRVLDALGALLGKNGVRAQRAAYLPAERSGKFSTCRL